MKINNLFFYNQKKMLNFIYTLKHQLTMKKIIAFFLLFASLTSFAAESPLRILSWNIKMLPRQFNGFIKHRPKERSLVIPQMLKSDSVDIICFQEAFDNKINQQMIKELSVEFPYVVGPANKKHREWRFKLNSGVIFFSRYPIKDLGSIRFDDCDKEDCWADKGGLLVEADVKGKKIQLLGTHMDAGSNSRVQLKQLTQLNKLLERFMKQGVPQIVCGDFNIDKSDKNLYQKMLDFLRAKDGPLSGDLQFSYDPQINDMGAANEHACLLDFILYRANGLEAHHIKRKIKRYKSKWCDSHMDLSDHFAIWMELYF